ncbi:MAG: hypothetical protein QM728_06845 [Gordonia sp. (in: high G+C Gram-positive bacteria)]|uniref:hypothetical protein n=1 Tax=Gordonia sp. (in: high G+C Gram-positive bacteria) TaxID=84139 RepID=UPI0039E4E465
MPQPGEPVLSLGPALVLPTIGPWAAAFAAHACAGDDLLDELRGVGAPVQIVDAESGAATDWLELTAAATSLSVRLPAPGDPAGIPPGPAGVAAAGAGEALVVVTRDDDSLIVAGEHAPDRPMRWLLHRVAAAPDPDYGGLGQARSAMIDAIGDATGALIVMRSTSVGDASTLHDDLARHTARYSPVFPPGALARPVDIAGLAARALAIVALARERQTSFGLASAAAERSEATLREVEAAARRALATAVNRVIDEYRR